MRYASLRNGLVAAICPSINHNGRTLPDLSGYNNHCALQNNSDPYRSWHHGVAASHDGTDDFGELFDNPSLNFGTEDFTITGWFLLRNVAAATSAFASENNPGAGNPQWWFRQENTSGAVRFLTADSVGETSITSSNGVVASNEWFFLCGRRSDTTLTIYKNGIAIASTTGTVRNVTANQSIFIGRFNTIYLNGLWDDFRAYRRALTESEISLLGTEPGIGLRPERTCVFFGAQLFNAAWARNSNVILSPVGAV